MGLSGEMGRSVYEQPGTEVDRILSQQGGFQISKREQRGAKGMKKGETKQGDCSQIVLLVLYLCT